MVTGSCVIRETTQTGCPWSRPRVSLSIYRSLSSLAPLAPLAFGSIQDDRNLAVLAFARLGSFCINRVGPSARRRRRRHQVGRHQIDDRRWHRLVRRRVGVGNLLELPAAAVLWCGCRSWLPVIAVTGSSSVATSGATGCCWLCCCLSGVTLARGVGLCWRHFLLGRRSHRADLHNPIDLCQGALPLGHVFVEASTTRRHDEFAALGATLPPHHTAPHRSTARLNPTTQLNPPTRSTPHSGSRLCGICLPLSPRSASDCGAQRITSCPSYAKSVSPTCV